MNVCLFCIKINLKYTKNWMFCSNVCKSVKTIDKLPVTDMH